MKWIVIYWLASQQPSEPPQYLASLHFDTEAQCMDYASSREDWALFECAHDDGSTEVTATVLSDIGDINGTVWITSNLAYLADGQCPPAWHPPLVCP